MTAIAIFVKTPGLSPIKTRLAERVGREAAEACHRKSAACVLATVQQTNLHGYWAVAETDGLSDPLWTGLPQIDQGPGSLGARMHRVHETLVQRHGSALLVGADLPQLQANDLSSAADWLTASVPRSVIGPAHDGGFWLFGSNHWYRPSDWTSVAYSQADTAQHFMAAMNLGEWKTLPTRCDLDQVGDLPRVIDELNRLSQPHQSQHNFVNWLSELRHATI